MTVDADAVRNLLEQCFPSGPPTDAQVRGQEVRFFRNHWTDRWPAHLPLAPILQGAEQVETISRQDVFARADSVDSEADAVDFYVAVTAWGSGSKAQRVARCVKVLHEDGAAGALLRSFTAVRAGNAVEAYRRLNTWGEDRIKYFGPAFFTKWLYFSGFDRWPSSGVPAPLILDARVAAAIGWRATRWPSAAYEEYLLLSDRIGAEWCPNESTHVVEYALFRAGGSIR